MESRKVIDFISRKEKDINERIKSGMDIVRDYFIKYIDSKVRLIVNSVYYENIIKLPDVVDSVDLIVKEIIDHCLPLICEEASIMNEFLTIGFVERADVFLNKEIDRIMKDLTNFLIEKGRL